MITRPHQRELCKFFRMLAPALLPMNGRRYERRNADGLSNYYDSNPLVQQIDEQAGATRSNYTTIGDLAVAASKNLRGEEWR